MIWYFSILIAAITIGTFTIYFRKESRKRLNHLYFRTRPSCKDSWSKYGKFNFKKHHKILRFKQKWGIWHDGEIEFILNKSGDFTYVRISRIYKSYLIRVDSDHSLIK